MGWPTRSTGGPVVLTEFEEALNEFCRSTMPLGWIDSPKCRAERDALWAAHQASLTALQSKLADDILRMMAKGRREHGHAINVPPSPEAFAQAAIACPICGEADALERAIALIEENLSPSAGTGVDSPLPPRDPDSGTTIMFGGNWTKSPDEGTGGPLSPPGEPKEGV